MNDSARPICAVSVDLDPLSCYYRIHALGEAPLPLRDVILRRGLPRFAELFAKRDIRATFFVVGSDLLGEGPGRALLSNLAKEGHELGNHSLNHPYDMARLSIDRVREEVGRTHDLIGEIAGGPPVGFRAPGYDISATMIEVILERGYRYDSSIFPAPLYWGAKALVMAAMRLRGRQSGAVLGNPRALIASPLPYRPNPKAPWKRGHAPLIELPVSVTPGLHIPAIGTSVLLAPPSLRRHLLGAMRKRTFFNFELHGIDLLDAEEDGIPVGLVSRQPDLRVPLLRKRIALETSLDELAAHFRFAPLREVVDEFLL